MPDVTQILSQVESGDPAAAERLLPLVYDELRKLASARLAQEKPGQTLQATALVHEAYLRLVGPNQQVASWDSRGRRRGHAANSDRAGPREALPKTPGRSRSCLSKNRTAPTPRRGDNYIKTSDVFSERDTDAISLAIPSCLWRAARKPIAHRCELSWPIIRIDLLRCWQGCLYDPSSRASIQSDRL